MLRPALLPLIRRVRSLLGEQDEDAYACSFWSDDAIADALDARALYFDRLPLARASQRDLTYFWCLQGADDLIWLSGHKNWDEATRIVDVTSQSVQPSHQDLLAGKWAFPSSVLRPFVVGFSYDLYGTAADLLLTKAAAKAARFDVFSEGQRLFRSQESKTLTDLAAQYRKKARPMSAVATRSDTNITGNPLANGFFHEPNILSVEDMR